MDCISDYISCKVVEMTRLCGHRKRSREGGRCDGVIDNHEIAHWRIQEEHVIIRVSVKIAACSSCRKLL